MKNASKFLIILKYFAKNVKLLRVIKVNKYLVSCKKLMNLF